MLKTLANLSSAQTFRHVDPATCRLWVCHNRDYAALTRERCADLIDGMLAQGRQEFPAIVRRTTDRNQFEIICGARRHWAVSWLRANGHPGFRYFIEIRDLTDEQAFRLADLENRERCDLSDFERARDYAEALELYYDGSQKTMAAAMNISESWLSRQLGLARLPDAIVRAFATPHDIREGFARMLNPALQDRERAQQLLDLARQFQAEQDRRRIAHEPALTSDEVMRQFRRAAASPTPTQSRKKQFKQPGETVGITMSRTKDAIRLDIPTNISRYGLLGAFRSFANEFFQDTSR